MKNNVWGLFALFFILMGCQPSTSTEEKMDISTALLDEQPTGEKMVVYQMMTRLFGNQNATNKPWGTAQENGVGKFADINEKALASLAELGVTHVWYTGVIEHAVIADFSKNGIAIDAPEVVKGRAGSPYAIKDYYDVNPDLATDVPNRMQEFEALIARTHAQGLKVLIDFVPNHVARAYRSDAKPAGVKDLGEGDDKSLAFSPSNNFYYIPGQPFVVPAEYKPLGGERFAPAKPYTENPAKATGNDQFTATPSVNDWFETVKLNYGVDYQNGRAKNFDPVPDTWVKMRDILLFWAGKGVDGFRCDMAEMVPVEFWEWAIAQVKQAHPGIVFVAEIYNPAEYGNYIQRGQFDYLYDKVQLYDSLKYVIQGKASTDGLPTIWQSLRGINKNMLRFLENHDEQRIASPDFAGQPEKALPALMVSATLYSGPIMIYFGQEVGEPGAGAEGFGGEDGRTTIFDYWGVPNHQKWMNNGAFDGGQLTEPQRKLYDYHKTLLNMVKTRPAFATGKLLDLQAYNRKSGGDYDGKVYSYLRFTDSERLLVVANFDAQLSKVLKLKIPAEALTAMGIAEGSEVAVGQVFPETAEAKTYTTTQLAQGIDLPIRPLESLVLVLK